MIASAFAFFGVDTATSEPGGTYHIRDDATGGDCTLIGNWDWPSKTCTLTMDVYETIQIDDDGITLDGDGNSIIKGSGTFGIYAFGHSDTTVKNVKVSGFSFGIYLSWSSSSTVNGNEVSGLYYGIYLDSSSDSTVSGNVVSGGSYGIRLYYSGGNTLRENEMKLNTYNFGVYGVSLPDYVQDIDTTNTVDQKPIYYWVGYHHKKVPSDAGYVGIVDSHHITVNGVEIENNYQGVLFAYTTDSVIKDSVLSDNVYGVHLHSSSDTTIEGSEMSVRDYGIYAINSGGSTVTGNVVSGGDRGIELHNSANSEVSGNEVSGGLYLYSSSGSIVSGNEVSSGGGYGIYLQSSTSVTVSENVVKGGYGIRLYNSGDSTVSGNEVSGGVQGIYLRNSGGNTLRENEMKGNTYNFAVVGGSLSDYIQDIDTTNTVDKKPIYYWVGRSYETVPSDAGCIGIVDSHHITVNGVEIRNNYQGVLFAYTTDSVIEDSVLSDNFRGIRLDHSSGATVEDNEVSADSVGIVLSYSSGNNLNGNEVSGDTSGIYLYYSSDNNVNGNVVSGGEKGINLRNSGGSILSGNVVSSGGIGIHLSYSGSSTVTGNVVSSDHNGIYIWGTSSNTVTGNIVSSVYYGDPSREIEITGVTGTNGKTTTCYLLRSIYQAAGIDSAMLTTIEYWIGKRRVEAELTTPESLDLHRILRKMAECGIKSLAMEVSSHGLALKRVRDVDFAKGVFTNLSRDHLDFHADMKGYLSSKRSLFENIQIGGIAALNCDDENWKVMASATQAKVVKFGFAEEADFRATGVRATLEGTQVEVSWMRETALIKSRLVGRHNAYNMMASAATAAYSGLPKESIVEGIRKVKRIPGRLEPFDLPNGARAFVDYAHTPDALQRVLTSLKEVAGGSVVCVFGCGGDRDKGKRTIMGDVSTRLADFTIVTSDNPRSENRESIIDDITRDLKRDNFKIEVDRKKAIEEALAMVKQGDCILVAGKGHEKFQIIGNRRIPLDDRVVISALVGKKN